MTVTDTAITCDGRTWDADGQPTGEVHGLRFRAPGDPPPTGAALREKARAAGWAVDVLAMCKSCRRPANGPVDLTPFQSTEE